MAANRDSVRCWGVVPAAGIGQRMAADLPKQYLPLAGSTVLEQTLHAMLGWGLLAGITVALHPRDQWWPALAVASDPQINTVTGGAQRSDSVLAALEAVLQSHRKVGEPSDPAISHLNTGARTQASAAPQ